MKNVYDVAIIGAGPAGIFASLRLTEKYPDTKFILLDISANSGKRRRFLEGYLGAMPTGDGKIYPQDIENIKNLVDGRKVVPASKWVFDYFNQVNSMKLIKNLKISNQAKKILNNNNFEIKYHDYYQWKPESVHKLSKLTSEVFKNNNNMTSSFDNEVFTINKQGNNFLLNTQEGNIICKKILLCVGRSGWRWVTNLYYDFGLIKNDDYSYYGVVLEANAGLLKDFKKSHCSFSDGDLTLGPLNWHGTIIPEDHSDLVISAFRSNEDRWKSDKVSFSLTKKIFFKESGCYQSDRIGKLLYLLYNDRVAKEKLKMYLNNKSILNIVPEYNWLNDSINKVEKIIPGISKKGFFHIPNIICKPAEIAIGDNLETELENMFIAGECSGISGIMAASTMGALAVDSMCR